MTNMPKIMIFGAGLLQITLIQTAKKLGYFTIVVDPDPNAKGKEFADSFYEVSGTDYNRTLEIATSNIVKGLVTSATDKPLLMMAKIAKVLNLPFPSEEAVYNTINKFELKKILLKNNIPCAKGIVSGFDELETHLEKAGLKFPVIVKPTDSSGSRGVFYCNSKKELVNSYADCVKYSKFENVLIEEYLEGPEISVEALVQNNNLHIIQITDKITTPFPYNVEMGHLQPSGFISEYFDEIIQVLDKSVKALKLNNCALHPELKITGTGVKIIEIGPRLGGDFITSHLTPLSTGINMEEQLIKISTGEPISLNRNINKYSAVIYFDLLSKPVNTEILKSRIQGLNDKISSFGLYYSDLSELPVITNSLERHGHVVFSTSTLNELLFIKQRLINT